MKCRYLAPSPVLTVQEGLPSCSFRDTRLRLTVLQHHFRPLRQLPGDSETTLAYLYQISHFNEVLHAAWHHEYVLGAAQEPVRDALDVHFLVTPRVLSNQKKDLELQLFKEKDKVACGFPSSTDPCSVSHVCSGSTLINSQEHYMSHLVTGAVLSPPPSQLTFERHPIRSSESMEIGTG